MKINNKDMICLAEITTTHGVKGAVKVRSFTAVPKSIFDYPELYDQSGKSYKIKLIAPKQSDVFIVTISGVTTCNDAELLRGTKLYISRDQLPDPDEDEFYYEDLIGMDVFTESEKEIGSVLGINNYGAGDILEIKTSVGKRLSVPFLREVVPTVDLNKRVIIINSSYLMND